MESSRSSRFTSGLNETTTAKNLDLSIKIDVILSSLTNEKPVGEKQFIID